MASKNNKTATKFTTKKCYECFTHVKLNAEVCPSCKSKLGEVNEIGLAKKPTNWKAYIICLLVWIGLGVFIWLSLSPK